MRWTPKIKAAIVADIEAGHRTVEQVCSQYDISDEEMTEWRKAYARNGRHGLHVTSLQYYNPERLRRPPRRLKRDNEPPLNFPGPNLI